MAWTAPKASTTARGYGSRHAAQRKAALSRYQPGDPCCLCGRPLGADTSRIHLDHNPHGGYRGLAHAHCNVSDGARRGAARQRRATPVATRTSRTW